MGKRLGELTRENTKCMVKVHEQTLIERMIGQLERLALRRIIIVIGYKGEKVRDLLGNKIQDKQHLLALPGERVPRGG